MEKDKVIKLRDALKAGMNLPVVVYIDNTFRIIDESTVFQFTKWDDENGILYVYSLTNPVVTKTPSNKDGTLSLFAVSYESIQAMEVSRLPLQYLPKSIDSLIQSGVYITSEWKDIIIERFNKALDPNIINMTNTDINKIMGLTDGHKAVNDNDDYYNGKYVESFAETVRVKDHNEYVEKVIENNKKQDNN